MQEKPAYTLREVADLLGVSEVYIRRTVRAGKLRVARLGHRTVRITDEALRDYLRAAEETGPRSKKERRREK
jgi:excisionase family DNA binding protein